jgi:mannose-6-phosphate isomerase
MLIPITNDPRAYAWGSPTAIAELLGHDAPGGPEAELWLGAHPGSPARILDPNGVGGHADLGSWIDADPRAALGPELAPAGRLPFLLKVLAAASPLSLQAHPTPQQAAAGFERENLAGIPADAPHRNYRDPHHKPELIVAVSDRFDALCGFRPVGDIATILHTLRGLDAADPHPRPDMLDLLAAPLDTPDPLRATVGWLLGGSDEVRPVVTHIVRLAEGAADEALDPVPASALETVRDLSREYPNDPGIAVGLIVHRVTLSRGQALYLPAGVIHAYLRGLGIELMAASDNVLRGGLTPKNIDVPELLEVLDFSPLPTPYLVPEEPAAGVRIFRPEVPDFVLAQIQRGEEIVVEFTIDGPAIVLATSGSAELEGERGSATIQRGEACYVTPDEGRLQIRVNGELYLATTGGTSLDVSAR